MESLEDVVLELFRVQGVKFGQFTLKSGLISPIYFDLRVLVSYPDLLGSVSALLWQCRAPDVSFASVCGVPYTALPMATLISAKHRLPMLIRRKEAKSYGTKKLIEGEFKAGDNCFIVEDVIVSGSSVYETATALRASGLRVSDAVVFIDRMQGGKENLASHGVNIRSVCNINQLLDILLKHGKVDGDQVKEVEEFLADKGETIIRQDACESGGRLTMTLAERVASTAQPVVRRLLQLMQRKRSNLCVAVDLTAAEDVLHMAALVGPHICLLKTHVDILCDFSEQFVARLRALAEEMDFLVCEDRKFADIGHTVAKQYFGGMYRVADWADLVTVHGLPGDGVLSGLSSQLDGRERGALLVAQMSSEGSLADAEYAAKCVRMAERHPYLVCGFVAQSSVTSDPRFLVLTPGVSVASTGDAHGQQYNSPETVVAGGTDVVIVGRGITAADDPAAACIVYKTRAFSALLQRLAESTE